MNKRTTGVVFTTLGFLAYTWSAGVVCIATAAETSALQIKGGLERAAMITARVGGNFGGDPKKYEIDVVVKYGSLALFLFGLFLVISTLRESNPN
jgi:hypothetical protein